MMMRPCLRGFVVWISSSAFARAGRPWTARADRANYTVEIANGFARTGSLGVPDGRNEAGRDERGNLPQLTVALGPLGLSVCFLKLWVSRGPLVSLGRRDPWSRGPSS